MYRRRYATSLDDNYFEDPGHCQGLIRFIGFYVPSDDRAAFYRGVFHIVYRRIDAEDGLPDDYIMQIDNGCCTSDHLKLSGVFKLQLIQRGYRHFAGRLDEVAKSSGLPRSLMDHLAVIRVAFCRRNVPFLCRSLYQHEFGRCTRLAHWQIEHPDGKGAICILVAVFFFISFGLDNTDSAPVRPKLVGDDKRQGCPDARSHFRTVRDDNDFSIRVDG